MNEGRTQYVTLGSGVAHKKRVFAVVGGGRWARVYIDALSKTALPFQVIVVSKSNVQRLTDFQNSKGIDFSIVSTVEQLLLEYEVEAAIVVNAARFHNDSASRLIEAGTSVLIEKPVALCRSQVELLYASAAKSGARVVPSLTFMHCSYFYRFAKMIEQENAIVIHASLEWRDPGVETRYGEQKFYDPTISVAQDIMPHVWAIFSLTLGSPPSAPVNVDSCTMDRGGRLANFILNFAGHHCQVSIEREAESRRRVLKLEMSSGRDFVLDFTIEPGTITVGSNSLSGDPNWQDTDKPVLRQLKIFLALLKQQQQDGQSIEASIGSVALAENTDVLLKQQQRSWLNRQNATCIDGNINYAIRELAT